MTISFGAVGATADGSSSLSVEYPSGIASGQMLLLEVASKGDTSGTPAHASTPSGWTFLAQGFAGVGSEGSSDSGSVALDFFTRVADGSETGFLSVTITGGTSAQGNISRYERTSGSGWLVAAAVASWTADNTNPISVTFGSDPGITSGDFVVIGLALNTNGPTGITSESLTIPGATADTRTQRVFTSTSTGRDQSIYLGTGGITAGTSTGAGTWQGSKQATAQGEGPAVLVRLREDAGASMPTLSASLSVVIQQARTAAATAGLAIQAPHTATASASLAAQQVRTAQASVQAALQQAQQATAAVSLAAQAAGAQSASLQAALQKARAATAALGAYLQAGSSLTADLDVAVQQGRSATASVSIAARVQQTLAADLSIAARQARSATAGISLSIQGPATTTVAASLSVAVQDLLNAAVSVNMALQVARSASAALSAYLVMRRAVSAAMSTAAQATRSSTAGLSLYIQSAVVEQPLSASPAGRRLQLAGRPANVQTARRPTYRGGTR